MTTSLDEFKFQQKIFIKGVAIYEGELLLNQTDFCRSMHQIHVTNLNQLWNLCGEIFHPYMKLRRFLLKLLLYILHTKNNRTMLNVQISAKFWFCNKGPSSMISSVAMYEALLFWPLLVNVANLRNQLRHNFFCEKFTKQW